MLKHKLLLPLIVILVLFSTITVSVFSNNEVSDALLQPSTVAEPVNSRVFLNYNEEQMIKLNGQDIKMKMIRSETEDTKSNDSETSKQFKVVFSLTNSGSENVKFSDIPVAGLSDNDFVLYAQTTKNKESSETVGNDTSVDPLSLKNLLNPNFELKPGKTEEGFFSFENEIKNMQIRTDNTTYIWKTGKKGITIQGLTLNSDIVPVYSDITLKKNKIAEFNVVSTNVLVVDNEAFKVVRFKFKNLSNEAINPAIYLPLVAVTTPGDIIQRTLPNPSEVPQIEGLPLTDAAFVSAGEEQIYYYYFETTTKYIQLQPPTENIHAYTRIAI